ncbi:MAG: hypothetical protein ABIG63_00515 [Chloroflexota bacterium]
MKKYFSSRFISLPLTLLVTLMLVGCGTSLEKGRKPSADWSRGVPLGTDVSGTLGFVVDQDGEGVHIVWPYANDAGATSLRYIQLDQRAEVVVDREITLPAGRVRTPRIAAAGEGLHLFWLNRPEVVDKWQLWYALLDKQGDIVGQAMQISADTSSVGYYACASDTEGGAVLVWEDTQSHGLNFTRLSSGGEVTADSVLIVAQGESPALRVDSQGKIHLAWMDDVDIKYALLDSDKPVIVEGTSVTHIPRGTGASVNGPALGFADGWVYIFWSILNQSGLEAGTANTQYIAFPAGDPEEVAPSRIDILPFEIQPYQTYQGWYNFDQFVPASYAGMSSGFVYDPVTDPVQQNELALALSFSQQYRLDSYIQIATGIFDDGQFEGYTLATRTLGISGGASLSSDADGHLHLVWQEGADGRHVYYATTAPDARAALDRFAFEDIIRALLGGGLESIAGVLLFPLAFPWMFLGLVLLVGWRLIRNDENLTHLNSRILLLVAIVMYQGTKLLLLPTMVEYVPFSAWMDVPAGWQFPLRIGVPLLIFGIALAVAELIRRRRQTTSTLIYYFSLVITDTILTLAVYGVNFFGAY